MLALFVMLFSFGFAPKAWAYDFSLAFGSNTLYFNIISGTTNVELTYPATNASWNGFTQPTGNLNLPGTVTYNGTIYTVTQIGSSAFGGCSGITAISIPNTMTYVDSYAFHGCTGLTSVTINSNAVASKTYSSSHSLKETFGSQVTSYTFGSSVTTIGACALYGCTNVTSVTLSNSVTSINFSAFEGCTGLTTVDLPVNLTALGNAAFKSCTGLTSVTFHDSVTSIADFAFENCTSLARVNITNLTAWCAIGFESQYSNPLFYAHRLYLYDNEYSVMNIPVAVESIGNYAFVGCTSLTQVIFDNALHSIGSSAFNGCTNLTRVDIANNVTSIGSGAFNGCTGLNEVHIGTMQSWCNINFADESANPLTVAHHLYDNYNGSNEITVLNIPDNVTSIANYAFSGCSYLTSVNLPNSVTSIGSHAFTGCTGLTQVYTPSLYNWCQISFANETANPLSYAHHLYDSSNEITALSIPSNVTSIKDYAFAGGTSIETVTLGNSLSSIGQYAFKGCTGLNSVTIPSAVQTIGNHAFDGCSALTSVTINSNAVASTDYSYSTSYYGNSDDNFRTRFGNQVTSYTFGQTVTSIGANALYDCTGMTQVTFNGAVTSIGDYAFRDCTSLTRVDIANLAAWCTINFDHYTSNPLYYAHHIYHNGNLVNNLDNLGSPASIGTYAFYGCTDLTSVTIPSSVQSVGNHAFDGCSTLTSVTINSNAVASADYSYSTSYYYPSYDNFKTRFGNQVTSYVLGPGVTAIGEDAFYDCTGMTQVTFNGAVTSIGEYAFRDCTSLTRVDIANLAAWCTINFDHYTSNPLYYAHHIYHNGNLVNNLDNLGSPASIGTYAFYGCTDLTSVTIPSSVQSVGNHAFDGCSTLTSVTINSNAVASADYSYSTSYYYPTYDNFKTRFGNQVTSYTFGSEVTAIGTKALYDCTGVSELYVKATTPPTITSSTFGNVPKSIPVYVPIGRAAAYRQAQYWSQFTNFVEAVFFDELHVGLPYQQPFASTTIPEGWGTYTGQLVWNSSTQTGTASLTPEDSWQFGQANGHTNSHAYTNIGSHQHYKWLISPAIFIDDELEGNIVLSTWFALTRALSNLLPITPGNQDHESLGIFYTANEGATWHRLTLFDNTSNAFENIPTTGDTYYYNLDTLRGQTVWFGIYAACTDANDAFNRIHVDDFNIGTYDLTAAPTAVTVTDVAGHSAKVSWTADNIAQQSWDIWVTQMSIDHNPNYEYWTIENLQQYGQLIHTQTFSCNYIVNNLTPNSSYYAWVRYRSGSVTSPWVNSDSFETVPMCAPPTDIIVSNLTSHSALVSWTPGQENQTSWDTYGGEDDMEGETVTVPYRLFEGLDPDTDYSCNITGYCEDGDGVANGVSIDFHTLPLPTLTLNAGTSQDNEIVPITCQSLEDKESRTQFILPAEMLTPMQYSEITKITFYDGNWHNVAPWGEDIWFEVKIMEVPESSYNDAEYPEEQFYGYWNDENFHQFNHGTLHIDSEGKVTINASYPYFHYGSGNLLIGVWQDHDSYDDPGTNYHANWLGTTTTDWSSMYVPAGEDPTSAKFLPKVTFTYETDAYLPPTNLQAEFLSANEIYLTWTPINGMTNIGVAVSESPDFPSVLSYRCNSVGGCEACCLITFDSPLTPESDYYIRAKAIYGEGSDAHYSAFGPTVVLTTPDACEPPAQLTATNVGPFSATLNWESSAEHVDVEYREVLGEEEVLGDPVIDYGFESSTLPFGWSTTNNGTGTGWSVNSNNFGHNSSGSLGSVVQSGKAADSWLFIPVSNKRGVLTFWTKLIVASNANTNGIAVYVTRSVAVPGTSVTPDYYTNIATTTYQKITVNLDPAITYSNTYYIAIRHFNASAVTANTGIVIDDVTFSNYEIQTNYGDWTSLGTTTENNMILEGLTPGHTYQFRVKAHCDTGFSSDWNVSESFTTVNNIVFQDAIAKSCCLTFADTDGDEEVSYAEAAAVTQETYADITIFQDQVEMHYFNELQYFTGLTEIPEYAFAGCVNLEEITLPPNITSIGYNAFGSNSQDIGCTSLTSIVIPLGVQNIGGYAFQHSGLTEVILPNSVTSIGDLAFGYCNSLEYVFLPSTVTSISGNAFTGNALANIEVEASNTVYDSRNGCNAIIKTATNELVTGCKNTVIPNGVTTIGISAFEYATGLTEITLPASVETIEEYAFLNCYGLTKINVQATTPPTLQEYAFKNLTLSNITVYVPCGSLAAYEASGWSDFHLVEDCNIQFEDYTTKQLCVNAWDVNHDGELSYREAAAVNSLNPQGESVFKSNTEITSFNELQYFTGLTELPVQAFASCTSLQSITLPPTVTSLGWGLFRNCSALQSINIPASVDDIGIALFSGCSALETITVDTDNTSYTSLNSNGIFEILENNNYKLVAGCKTTVIPEGVTTVGSGALEQLYGVTSLTLPSTLESVVSYGILYLYDLESLTVNATTPPTLSSGFLLGTSGDIPITVPCGSVPTYQAANGWSNFTNFIDPCNIVFADENVKAICVANWDTNGDGELSYDEAAAVTTLKPNGATNSVFYNNSAITSFDELQYFTNLTSIEANAFSGCSYMTSITIPNNVTTIATMAFSGCYSLTSINIPTSVTTLEGQAFNNCTGLTSMFIPASVTEIPITSTSPFSGCSGLESITVDEENTTFTDGGCNAIIRIYDHRLFAGCKNTIIPDDIVIIHGGAFQGCTGLTTLVIPNQVTTINLSAFNGCTGLTSLTLGSGVTSIAGRAFLNCSNLESITVLATTPPTLGGTNANVSFYNVPTTIPVYVPCEAIEAYQQAQYWSDFTNIQENPEFICFEDANVKAICVANWDANGDGELSYAETAAVNSLNPQGESVFKGNTEITSFNELQYFTGLHQIAHYTFQDCSSLTSITLPPTVTEIKYNAFKSCGLTGTLTIPNSVTTIEQDAFKYCSGLTGLVIGSGVTSIGSYAFSGCTGLTYIEAKAINPPTLGTYGTFNSVPAGIPVYVPCEALADYLDYNNTGQPWGGFTNIVGEGCNTEFSAGWNWWTPLVETTVSELKNALDAHNATGEILINSQDGGFLRRSNGTWGGTLSSIEPGKMYKVKTESSSSFDLNGDEPQTVTVSLEPGYTWFGFVSDTEAALISDIITPNIGDKITQLIGENTYTYTFDGTTWSGTSGTIRYFQLGHGYIYYNSSNETKTITFSLSY